MLLGGDIASLKKKKNLFSLKDCSRVDRTKSHRNDTFMYLHLDTLTHAVTVMITVLTEMYWV